MKFKFYNLAKKKVILTVTDIPSNMWPRKGLLPYERIFVNDFASTRSTESTIDIQADKVIETITRYTVQKTIQQVKHQKKIEINNSCLEEIYETYPIEKQVTAILGIYPSQYLDTMKAFITEKIDKSNNLVDQVNLLETIDEIKLIDWQTEVI